MDPTIPNAELFMKYDYPETRELMKAFLTLVSATLVLSLTFSEKITKTHDADARVRRLMFSAWALFFIGIILGGASILFIAGAAGCTIYGDIPLIECGGWTLALWSWCTGLMAGISYVIGLLCLTFAARRSILLGN